MKNKKAAVAGILLLFVFCALPFAIRAQKEEKEKKLVVGIALNALIPAVFAGGTGGAAEGRELFDTLTDEIKRLYGYTVTLKIYPAPKFLFQDFQKGKIDFTNFGIHKVLYAKNHGIPFEFFGYINKTGKKEVIRWCFWVRKDSGIKNVKQLKGKTVIHSFPEFLSRKDELPPKESYIYWVIIKKLLEKNGIHEPFKKFFKDFKALPVLWINIGYAVVLKNFDAFASPVGGVEGFKSYDKQFADLVPLSSCLDINAANHPSVYREGLNPEIIKTAKSILLHPPIDKLSAETKKKYKKELKNYKPPVLVGMKDYDLYFKWLKEAEKKGWLKEFDEIMKNTPKPKFKRGEEKMPQD